MDRLDINNPFPEKYGLHNEYYRFNGKKIQQISFDSMDHMVRTMDATENDKKFYNQADGSGAESIMDKPKKKKEYDKWTYGSLGNWETSRKYLDEGRLTEMTMNNIDKYYNQLIQSEKLQQLSAQAKSTKRRRVFKDDGSELDIDRLMSGSPDYWQSMTKGRKSNTVKLFLDGCASSGTDEKKFAEVAGLACAVSDLLTRAGYCVEIMGSYMFKSLTNETDWSVINVPLKQAEAPMDMQLIGQYGNTGLFRNVIFRATVFSEGRVSYGIGQATVPPDNILQHMGIKHYVSCKWDDGKNKLVVDKLFEELCNQTETEPVYV